MPHRFYVYLWRDPKDRTPRYVGKGKRERVWTHLTSRTNPQTNRMLRKRFEEGYVCLPNVWWVETEKEALELETFLITEIGRVDLGTGPLFNLTDGGEGQAGRVFTAEHRAKLSRAGKGRKITGAGLESIRRAARERVFSADALARIGTASRTRKTMLGRKHTPEAIEKMRAAKRHVVPWNKGMKQGHRNADI